MASFVLSTSKILSLLVLFVSLVVGLATRPIMLSVVDKTLNNDWSIMKIAEYQQSEILENSIKQSPATTRVILNNNAVLPLYYFRSISWSGAVVGQYPNYINVGSAAQFTHNGVSPIGSKGAVIYLGPNLLGVPDRCAFVFAWSTPANSGSLNKIYVETGLGTNYLEGNPQVWPSIENKLDTQGKDTFSYTYTNANECAFTSASATITTSGNNPVAYVNFFI